jgi:hypothetical protein
LQHAVVEDGVGFQEAQNLAAKPLVFFHPTILLLPIGARIYSGMPRQRLGGAPGNYAGGCPRASAVSVVAASTTRNWSPPSDNHWLAAGPALKQPWPEAAPAGQQRPRWSRGAGQIWPRGKPPLAATGQSAQLARTVGAVWFRTQAEERWAISRG